MIIVNPEFHRNLWLRFSPWRIIAMPLLVFLTLGMFVKFTDEWASATSSISLTLFYVVVFIWGNYEAAKAPVEELREKTWDFQKMSSLSPWQLVLGKFFGTTSYVWYFGVTLLVVFCIAQNGHAVTGKVLDYSNYGALFSQEKAPFAEIIFCAALLVMSGLIGHATAFFIGLYQMKINRFGVIGAFIVGLITSHTALSFAQLIDFSAYFGRIPATTGWLGMEVVNNNFVLLSMAFGLCWLIIGNQRLMREEIGFRNKPVAWGLFIITFGIYLAGLFGGAPFNAFGGYIAAFIFALICGYGVMVNEASELTMYRKFLHGWRTGHARAWQENLPKWAVAAAVVMLLIPLVSLNADSTEHRGDVLIFLIGVCLFALRDGLVLHAILLPPGGRYGRFSIFVFWLLVYFLLPGWLVGDSIGHFLSDALSDAKGASDLRMSMSFFFPVATAHHPVYILPVIGEIVIGFFFLKNRLEKISSGDTRKNAKTLPHSEKQL